MRVSLKWLKELLPAPALTETPLSELCYTFDMTGTAVESVETVGAQLPGVVIGQILTKEHHPQADKLWVTTVDVGGEEPVQIVCGAQNFEAGDKIPVATVGAVLPDGTKIKKAKLRGEVSYGMNCSAKELGVGAGNSGLMILPADAPVGTPFAAWYGAGDTIFDFEITPNRPDCLSMVGVAREFGAVFHVAPVAPEEHPLAETGPVPIEQLASVTVEDSELCQRYCARVIRGVKVGPSPAWLAERVEACGARSINNVVDVTNYLLFEMGQPLHAFDYGKLAKNADGIAAIHVRRATTGEHLETLDGVERVLTPCNIVIADADGASCLAGVMGGAHSEVENDTVDIFLESAVFDSETTSRTSRSLGLISESSLRFERRVDAARSRAVLDRAAALMVEVAGGAVAPGVIDVYPQPVEPVTVNLRAERLAALVGAPIPLADAAVILRRLGFSVDEQPGAASLELVVPTFRPDVTREVDVIEEVLRLYGMERIPSTLPGGRGRIGGLSVSQQRHRRLGGALRACGLNETMTYAFCDPTDLNRIGWEPEEGARAVELHNPMSSEQAVLRPTMLAGLLNTVSSNIRHGVADVHLYEMGKVFVAHEGAKQPEEHENALGILTGSWQRPAWNDTGFVLDFFDAKGVLENVARELCVDRMRLQAGERPWLQPGRAADILLGKQVVGWVGEIHPRVADAFGVEQSVVAFEFAVDPFLAAAKPARDFVAPPRFPAVELDVALIVPEEMEARTLEQRILSLGRKAHLVSIRLFDVYRGKGIEPGSKSLAYTFEYRCDDRTLAADEVETAHAKLLERLATETGAHLR